jgi:ribosomal protein S18 acetylase RimI-like enzyme
MQSILPMILRRDARLAQRVVELDGMRAHLDPRIPNVWDANWLLVERPGLAVETILAAADETLGGAGMRHRTLFAYDRMDAERLIAALEPEGWEVERGVYMVHRRAPDRPADAEIAVEETALAEVAEVRREFLRDDLAEWFPAGVSEEVLDQYLAFDRTVGEISGDRWFVVRETGRVAAFCRLLSDEGVGQVEDVATMPHARNRGYARAVVLAAVAASRAAGHELTFLGALADDWPRGLYARLGFDEVGDEAVLYRKPR